MAISYNLEVIVAIIGVIGTWIGVYFGYRVIKKQNEKTLNNITTLISNNKTNTQVGRGNRNAQ